jgi:hypothetical protein
VKALRGLARRSGARQGVIEICTSTAGSPTMVGSAPRPTSSRTPWSSASHEDRAASPGRRSRARRGRAGDVRARAARISASPRRRNRCGEDDRGGSRSPSRRTPSSSRSRRTTDQVGDLARPVRQNRKVVAGDLPASWVEAKGKPALRAAQLSGKRSRVGEFRHRLRRHRRVR